MQSNYACLDYFNDLIKEKVILSFWQIKSVMIWVEIKFTSEKERKKESLKIYKFSLSWNTETIISQHYYSIVS